MERDDFHRDRSDLAEPLNGDCLRLVGRTGFPDRIRWDQVTGTTKRAIATLARVAGAFRGTVMVGEAEPLTVRPPPLTCPRARERAVTLICGNGSRATDTGSIRYHPPQRPRVFR